MYLIELLSKLISTFLFSYSYSCILFLSFVFIQYYSFNTLLITSSYDSPFLPIFFNSSLVLSLTMIVVLIPFFFSASLYSDNCFLCFSILLLFIISTRLIIQLLIVFVTY